MGPESLFHAVVSDRQFTDVLEGRSSVTGSSLSRRLRRRLLPWFWPRILDASSWVESSETRGWNPYSYLRSEPRRLLQRLLQGTQTNESVLDLGCNCGSDLDILRRRGFTALYGVDAGIDALDIFAREFPVTWQMATVENDLFQRYLYRADTNMVDVIHSHGATLELVHPSFPLIKHMCRVAQSRIYIQIMERGHSYPRDYIGEFRRHGFDLIYADRNMPEYGESLLEFHAR